jgi:hypothetical protein
MRFPRLTVRRLMIVVAIVAVGLGSIEARRRWSHLASEYRAKAMCLGIQSDAGGDECPDGRPGHLVRNGLDPGPPGAGHPKVHATGGVLPPAAGEIRVGSETAAVARGPRPTTPAQGHIG